MGTTRKISRFDSSESPTPDATSASAGNRLLELLFWNSIPCQSLHENFFENSTSTCEEREERRAAHFYRSLERFKKTLCTDKNGNDAPNDTL